MQANTLLIVEDDPDIRACLEEIMVSEGFEVLTAAHGREALQALQSAQTLPALILLDLTMPVMDGPQFLAELASGRWPVAWPTPPPGRSICSMCRPARWAASPMRWRIFSTI